MSIWGTLFGQVVQRTAKDAVRKAAQDPQTREKAGQAARQASEKVRTALQDGNAPRSAGQAVGSVFVKLKQGVDRGFDAPPRDWGGEDEDPEKK